MDVENVGGEMIVVLSESVSISLDVWNERMSDCAEDDGLYMVGT